MGEPGSAGPAGRQGAMGDPGLAGLDSLIRTDLEAPGANCPAGGVRIEAGLDDDRDGVLSAAEVDGPARFLCQPDPGPLAALEQRVAELESMRITQSITLAVTPGGGSSPTTFASIQEALEWLSERTIAGGAWVQIDVAAGTYTSTAPITVDHGYANHVRIEGAGVGATTLQFDQAHGLQVRGGVNLAYFGGFTLQGLPGGGFSGIRVHESSSVQIGPLTIRDFTNRGVDVYGGSSLRQDNGPLIVEDCQGVGVAAGANSHILLAAGAEARRCENGFQASQQSSLVAPDSTSEFNDFHGYSASEDAYMRIDGAIASSNGGMGVQAAARSAIYMIGGDASGNQDVGAIASGMSYLWANQGTYEGNVVGAVAALHESLVSVADSTVSRGGTGPAALTAQYGAYLIPTGVTFTGSGSSNLPTASSGPWAGAFMVW